MAFTTKEHIHRHINVPYGCLIHPFVQAEFHLNTATAWLVAVTKQKAEGQK